MPTRNPVLPRLRVGIAAVVRGFTGSGGKAGAACERPGSAP